MRPILLEIDGFCSYRTKAVIDFCDADFFVLVGPTGSGKSTVIDAMVFALYGTVPRWDDRSAVAPALAPSATRGVVRLIFDAGGKRYVVLRDVRRSGGKTSAVSVKEARLEQFVDSSATGDPEDATQTIAVGKEVSRSVEGLLGLNFDQFTQSVALPQGEFARFLHAKNADRQQILKNLLGHTIYDRIQSTAFAQSKESQVRADALAEQLLEFADATAAHVSQLSTATDALLMLQTEVTSVTVPGIRHALKAADDARQSIDLLFRERALLSAITRPDGIDALETQRRGRIADVQSAEEKLHAVELHERQLRTDLQTATPRHELERRLESWTELHKLEVSLPQLTLEVSHAQSELSAALEARASAESAAAYARDTATQAAQAANEANERVARVEKHLAQLKGIEDPDGVQALGVRLAQVQEFYASASAALDERQQEQTAAASALEGFPSATALAAAQSTAEQLIDLVNQDRDEAASRASLLEAVSYARIEADAALTRRAIAEQALRDAEHANQAAALRADLHAGDECPVCGHEIVELRVDALGVDLEGFREALRTAQAQAEQASDGLAKREAFYQRSEAIHAERLQRCRTLASTLREHISTSGVDMASSLAESLSSSSTDDLSALGDAATSALTTVKQILHERVVAETRRRDADAAAATAQETVRAAAQKLEECTAESHQARAAVHAARDTVSELSPPAVADLSVPEAWKKLVVWAADTQEVLAAQAATLTAAARESAKTAEQLNAALEGAEAAARDANERFTHASLENQKSESTLNGARDRIVELTGLLKDAPGLAETTDELGSVVELQSQLDKAAAEVLAARASTEAAQEALALADGAVAASFQMLQRSRDPLVQFGAPEVIGSDLTADWDRMISWAAAEAEARSAQILAQQQVLDEAENRSDRGAKTLVEQLLHHGVEVDTNATAVALAEQAPTTLAQSVAAAEAAVSRARERRSQSQKLRTEMEKARESAEVAQMLSLLMRANGFPRWLLASALDTLLRDASSILLQLSGGQFELTRNEQDLLVIDHNDADMSRLVKTLSGGETFQASLALALALSEQVTSMSTAGACKLESIFLDEGFGTLDEATLDVVASTLESLASSGSRMVGVITHVPALAERIPVRFEVIRDNAGSHIERLAV